MALNIMGDTKESETNAGSENTNNKEKCAEIKRTAITDKATMIKMTKGNNMTKDVLIDRIRKIKRGNADNREI